MDYEEDDYEFLGEHDTLGYNKNTLKYGSIIYLTFNEDNKNEYYAQAEGFNKTRIVLKEKTQFKKDSEFINGLFKIYPSFYNIEYKKAKEKFENFDTHKQKSLFNLQLRKTRREIPQVLKAVEEEQCQNFDVFEKLKGTPIRFGQTIQLLHVSSQKYLTFEPDEVSDYESDCLKVELRYESSENSCFRILPSFKYQQESQGYIYHQDLVYLISNKDNFQKIIGEPYLHASRQINDTKSKREINISTDKKSQWRIKIFSDFIDEKKGLLSIGDIIWINLSEDDKNLVVSQSLTDLDYHFFSFVSDNATEKSQRIFGNSNGLFIIESLDMEIGGLIKWDKEYRIKHLTTNKYLAINKGSAFHEGIVLGNFLKLTSDEKEAENFKFDIIYSTISSKQKQLHSRFLQKDAYFRLKTTTIENDNEQKLLWLNYKDTNRDNLPDHTQNIETDFVTIPFLSQIQDENIFHLSKANQGDVLITLFLISSKKTIENCLKSLKKQFIEFSTRLNLHSSYKIIASKLDQMKKCLNQLDQFCKNKLLEYLSFDQSYGTGHNRLIQNILRQQLFIELLIRVLIENFPNVQALICLKKTENDREMRKRKSINYDNASKKVGTKNEEAGPGEDIESVFNDLTEELNHKKKKICDLVYKLLTSICFNNRTNELYISKYLPIFQLQAIYIPSSIDTIISILKDNEELLLNLHKAIANDQLIENVESHNGVRDGDGDDDKDNHNDNGNSSGYMKQNDNDDKDNLNDDNLEENNDSEKMILEIPKGPDKLEDEKIVFENLWIEYYDKIMDHPKNEIRKLFTNWNTIKFFTLVLKNCHSPELIQKTLDFFNTIAVSRGQGINVNQEDTFKYFTCKDDHGQTLMDRYLFKIISKQKGMIPVEREDVKNMELFVVPRKVDHPYPLQEFMEKFDTIIDYNNTILNLVYENDTDEEDESFVDTMKPKDRLAEQLIYNQLNLLSSMCTSRNFSWKNFIEKQINFYALLNAMSNIMLPPKIKSVICELIKNLYIDQEPRRIQDIPHLCKTIQTLKNGETIRAKNKKNEPFLDNETKILKSKIEEYITGTKRIIAELPEEYKADSIANVEYNLKIEQVYNNFIYSVIRLTNLMFQFDIIKITPNKINTEKYEKKNTLRALKTFNIVGSGFKGLKSLFESKQEDVTNQEVKNILRALIQILRFDFIYTDAEKIMKKIILERREKKNSSMNPTKIVNKTFGFFSKMTDLFKVELEKEEKKKVKKKEQNLDFLFQDITGNEIYLKQAEVMKKVLQALAMHKQSQIENVIKFEILRIVEFILDYKQDELLTNIKNVFVEFVYDYGSINEFHNKHGELIAIIDERLPHYIKYIIPSILSTGTEVDDTDENVRESLKNDDILDLNKLLDYDLLPVLLQEFCLNNDQQVQIKTLEVIFKMYNQRENFLNNVKDLMLLFDGHNIEVYGSAKQALIDLEIYCSKSEIWLKPDNIDYDGLDATENLLIYFYNTLFLNDNYKNNMDIFDSSRLNKHDIDPIKQNMFRHLKIYNPIINLLRDNIFIIESNQQDEKINLLFEVCLRFLTAFVKKNPMNQELISNYLSVFYYEIETDIGQIALLCEIFRDNFKLCTTKHHEVIRHLVNLIIKFGRKTHYLHFFELMQNIQDEWIYLNQKLLLDTFLDPSNKTKLLYMSHKEFDFSSSQNKNDEPFKYHAKLLEILGMTAIGKEGLVLNELRLRGAFEFGYLVSLLIKPDNFSHDEECAYGLDKPLEEYDLLKIPILKFIYYVYFESEKMTEELNKYNEKFIKYVNYETQRIRNHQSYQTIFFEYFFEHFLPVTFLFFKMVKMDDQANEEEGDDQLIKLDGMKNLLETMNETNFLSKNITKISKKNLIILEQAYNLAGVLYPLELAKIRKDSSNLGDFKIGVQPRYIELAREGGAGNSEDLWKKVWDSFLGKFLEADDIKNSITQERRTLAKALMKIEVPYAKDSVMKDIVNREEIIKKLINIASNEEVLESDPGIVIQILQILGDVINIEDDEKKKKESMEFQQNFLNKNGATLMLISKLSHPELPEIIFEHLVKFGSILTEGGNLEVQKSIYRYFTNFSNSAMFFKKIHDKITTEIINVKKMREDSTNDLKPIKVENRNNILEVLKFLQLLAEGHNSDLQNYLRQQTNSYHNYDILSDITDLLDSYMQYRHSDYFDVIVQCFDTITEYIQGPCYENQVAVMQGNFLDMASSLFSIDEILEDILAKKKNGHNQEQIEDQHGLKKWQIARIKYKCSITLISLLEGRKDNDIMFRMLKSLQIDIIKRNIYDIYKMFLTENEGIYDDSVFNHFDHSPEEKDKETNNNYTDEHCSFIIETGFNLFFLLNSFMEIKANNFEEDEEEEEEESLLTNNIVGKLGKFGITFITSAFRSVAGMASNVVDKTKSFGKNILNIADDNKDDKEKNVNEDKLREELNQERFDNFKDAFDFFKKHSAHIEVLREKSLEKTYFYVLPFCLSLTEETKLKFHETAVRISVKSKVTSLQQGSGALIETIEYEYQLNKLFNKIELIALLAENIMIFRDIAFLLAITINILVLFSFEKDKNDDQINLHTEQQIRSLGVILIFLSLLIVAYFLLKTAPPLIKKAWKGVEKDKISITNYIFRLAKTFFYFLSDFFVLYYGIYGLTAVIGVSLSPYFFAFHLFDVIVRYPTLANVIKSIWNPKKALFLTLLLFLLFQYTFTLIGYYWLVDYYHGYCSDTWVCFLTAVDKSFKSDGALGGFLDETNNVVLFRFFFDNLYFFILMIIMLNIILGIIIDTFKTLRDKDEKFEQDMENVCFICGKNRETIDKASEVSSFESHIENDHNVWNYLFYIAYITKKISTEYTGIESYVAEKIQKEEISWFPTHRALILKDEANDDGSEVIKVLKEIQQDQIDLQKYSRIISKNIAHLESLHREIKKDNLTKKKNLHQA